MTTAAEAMQLTVSRDRTPPATGTPSDTPKPAADSGLWEGFTGQEPAAGNGGSGGNGGRRNGQRGQRKELPPLRTLAARRRKPTGRATHPVMLVSGGDHSGKSFELALLTGDTRIGHSYWFEIGRETTANWYGSVPGADYEIIEHDGSWRDLMAALAQAHAEAHATVNAPDYDGKPPLLCLDSMSGEWELLRRIAYTRAAASQDNIEKMLADPHAEVDIGPARWNPINDKHKDFMTLVASWPGPVVMTARGKMSLGVDERGNIDYRAGKRYTVNAQQDLAFEAAMHVKLDKVAHPEILGFRHPQYGIGGKGSKDKTLVIDPDQERTAGVVFSLAWLLFDVMRYDPASAVAGQVNDPAPNLDDEAAQDRPMPVVRQLAPAQVPGADEAPGQPVPETVSPALVG